MNEVRSDRYPPRNMDASIRLFAWLLWIPLLTACDPVSRPIYTVDRLDSSNNNLYAQISVQNSFGIGEEVEEE